MDISEYIRNITEKIQIAGGGGLKLDSNNNYNIQDKKLEMIVLYCIVFHQLQTGLATRVDKNLLSSPSQNIGNGKFPLTIQKKHFSQVVLLSKMSKTTLGKGSRFQQYASLYSIYQKL